MKFLLLLLFLPQEGEPPQTFYREPPQAIYVQEEKPAKQLPVWLGAQYAYPNWTYPGSIYNHLFEEPHYSILKKAGYTDQQLRSISVREAELLHNHLHNYFDRGPGRFTNSGTVPQKTFTPSFSFSSGSS